MSSPAQPSLLILFLFLFLSVRATHALPLTITNTTSLNQPPSSSLFPTIIYHIPNTYPILILHIEPVPYPIRLDPGIIPIFINSAISYQRRRMVLRQLTRSSLYPDRFSWGISTAFTLQGCDMGASDAPNPWQAGNLLDVMAGVGQVADQIHWESGITVFRSVGPGAAEEVAAGALYKNQPREGGEVMAPSTAGGAGSVGGNAPQLSG